MEILSALNIFGSLAKEIKKENFMIAFITEFVKPLLTREFVNFSNCGTILVHSDE